MEQHQREMVVLAVLLMFCVVMGFSFVRFLLAKRIRSLGGPLALLVIVAIVAAYLAQS